jgi:hypothetical protein
METLNTDTLYGIVSYLYPYTNLSSLLCSCSWLYKNIVTIAENNQWKPLSEVAFSGTTLLTPCQIRSLEELLLTKTVNVSDVDNGIILLRALHFYLLVKR